jgi:leucyl-tRNA synthetase
MFLGPWEQGGEWSDSGINGVARWLNRVWEVARRDPRQLDERPSDPDAQRELDRAVHKTVRRVSGDIKRFKFNTALAALMELTNTLTQEYGRMSVGADTWSNAVEKLLLLMSPLAPHVAEELWEAAGHPYSIHQQPWPHWDEELAADEVVTLVVQVNGRLRDRIEAPVHVTEEEARQAALGSERVRAHTAGKTIARVIYVPGKLVNIVAR